MAGGSALDACLKSDFVEEVRVVTRRPMPGAGKMRVIVHEDYLDYSAITETFQGIDHCLFCLGVSVHVNTSEEHARFSVGGGDKGKCSLVIGVDTGDRRAFETPGITN